MSSASSSLALPEGWKRIETKRSHGLSSGKIEVCYISPTGKKIKSKPELSQYLGTSIDLTTFDFKTGRINSSLLRKAKYRKSGLDYQSLKMDQSLISPVRQTSPILKKSVVYMSTQPNSTVLNYQQIKDYYKKSNMSNLPIDSNCNTREKPYQVFWQKRLQGLRAKANFTEEIDNFQLPSSMKAFMSSLSDKDTLLRSVTAALHLNLQTIRGQDKSALQKDKEIYDNTDNLPRNPVAFVNPHQPLIISTTITEDDIRRQEELVQVTRQKLTTVIQDLYP